jgi:hypothetical protein
MKVNSERRVLCKPSHACALWRQLKTTILLVGESDKEMSKELQRVVGALYQHIIAIQFSDCKFCAIGFSGVLANYVIY